MPTTRTRRKDCNKRTKVTQGMQEDGWEHQRNKRKIKWREPEIRNNKVLKAKETHRRKRQNQLRDTMIRVRRRTKQKRRKEQLQEQQESMQWSNDIRHIHRNKNIEIRTAKERQPRKNTTEQFKERTKDTKQWGRLRSEGKEIGRGWRTLPHLSPPTYKKPRSKPKKGTFFPPPPTEGNDVEAPPQKHIKTRKRNQQKRKPTHKKRYTLANNEYKNFLSNCFRDDYDNFAQSIAGKNFLNWFLGCNDSFAQLNMDESVVSLQPATNQIFAGDGFFSGGLFCHLGPPNAGEILLGETL